MLLHHGTTRQRAESIRDNGPDVDFVEPEDPFQQKAREFHVAPAHGPFDCGSPEDYARKKAKSFPNEGGPAILEIELSDDIASAIVGELEDDVEGKACNWGSDIWFEPGFGLEELLELWDQLDKRVIILQDK